MQIYVMNEPGTFVELQILNYIMYKFCFNLPQNYFWCNIFRRSKHLFIRELTSLLVNISFIQISCQWHQSHFAQTEVSQLDVSQGSDQQVIRFKIPMYNAVARMYKKIYVTAFAKVPLYYTQKMSFLDLFSISVITKWSFSFSLFWYRQRQVQTTNLCKYSTARTVSAK